MLEFAKENKSISSNFSTQHFLGSMSEKSNAVKSREVYFKGIVYDFSVYYNAIDKSHILNIHQYLMVDNNIK